MVTTSYLNYSKTKDAHVTDHKPDIDGATGNLLQSELKKLCPIQIYHTHNIAHRENSYRIYSNAHSSYYYFRVWKHVTSIREQLLFEGGHHLRYKYSAFILPSYDEHDKPRQVDEALFRHH